MIGAETETVFAAFEDTAARHPERGFLNVLPELSLIHI